MSSISQRQLQRRLRHAEQAQQALRQELQQLREQSHLQSQAAAGQLTALLQTISTGLLAQDEHCHIKLINQRLCDLLALPDPPAAYIGQDCHQVLRQSAAFRRPDDVLQQADEAMRAQLRRAELVELANGRVLQREYLPVVQNGRTMLHLWSYEDVTRQRQVQAHVQELSQLAEQSPDPIICFGHDGQARYANPAAGPVLRALARPEWQPDREFLHQQVKSALQENTSRIVERQLDGAFYHWTIVPLLQEEAANIYLTDITARRQAETQLRHSQLLMARINDTIPAVVFLYDLQAHRLNYINRQIERVLGYPEQTIETQAGLLQQIIHPEDLRSLFNKRGYLQALPDGELSTGEYRVRHQNGNWRWLWIRSTAFTRDENGLVYQVLCSAEDITQRKATEEALRQSQLLVERVAYTAPNLIYIYDLAEKRNVYSNRHIEVMLGYTEEEIQEMGGEVLERLMPPTEVQRLREHYEHVAQLADSEILSLEFHLTHRNGSARWLRVTDTPFERDAAGQVRQIVGVGEDITRWKVADEQRRTANRRLAEQNRLFRQVIDTTPHLIYLKDNLGNYLLANRATAELYGMTPEQIVGAQPDQLPAMLTDGQRYRQQDEQVLRTGQELIQEETFTKPDGEILWFYSIKRPFVLADGNMQVLGVDINITELKRTQLDLHAAKEAAEENAQAKQNFLANMSHEIRTPLNGILGMAGLLSKTPLDDQQSQFLGHIRHSADHLLVVINDVLAMAQLGAGKIRPENIPFDLREVLRASQESLLPRAQEKGIALELELPPATVPTTVLGDPHRLRQVLLNLLSNAVKFTEHGQVLLTCRRLSQPGEEPLFQFQVLDTGPGIPPDQLQEMFEPFTQASASTAREYGGSGLGLSISRGLVDLMGGTMMAESRLHEGSTFGFTLTFRPAEPTAVKVPAKAATNYRELGARRVLLAEDNAVNQFLVESLLRGWGWTVDTASTGPDALALFDQHSYDIVLMDIQMPGMDGVAATRRLRQHPEAQRAATPVLALTAHALRGEAERYAEAGFSGYLSKPFREEDLFRTIAAALGKRPAVESAEFISGAETANAPLYSLSGIRRLAHGNEEFVRRLAHLFIQTTPPAVRELEQHAASGQCEQLAAAAHHLKSSLDGLHIRQLHAPIRRLEACRDTPLEPQEAQQLVTLVREVTEQVMAGLRRDFPGL
ncbi:PAS domain S-box protein [Hymenobacter sediminicola]|uniref:histidine kinase n=1 Tax=Hymenobacter sediminicola TaxID=2761579 RepID=A0A7G7W8F6_9BACT|nr:PAS domain S-box protein [Hymenobacter sediminicola]QNH62649.1 PAS domain S-box protein [Hymenobacter sediminicola]